jgi:leucine dehydrogenase
VLEDLVRDWDGEETVIRFDRPSGTWMFVCLHSTRRGPAGGGTRMATYSSPDQGLADAMRLSAAMTRKMAVLGAPFGGGKAVLAVPELPNGQARRNLLLRYGELVASLGGTFRTAADINTSAADMDVIAERCSYVYGRTPEHGGGGDSGWGTARGVFHGIRASLGHVFGSEEVAGRRVLVQGVGSVGAELARTLAEAGADVLVADMVADLAAEVAASTGATLIRAEGALETSCDVYAPCAVGRTLSSQSIPRLRCRIVAGSANNQLTEPKDADRLRAAGILYAPDYVINAGGVLQLLGLEDLGWDEPELEQHLEGIGTTLRGIYAAADAEGMSTEEAADRVAASRLASEPRADRLQE